VPSLVVSGDDPRFASNRAGGGEGYISAG